jgi:hypothetical protein
MALSDIYNAANDAMFQGRCLAAVWKAAQDITAEDPQTEGHARRYDWAVTVLRDSARITPRQLAMQVLRNATIASNPGAASDGDLQFQVNSIVADLMAIG